MDKAGRKLSGAVLIFSSPLNLIASGNPFDWGRVFDRAGSLNIQICYLRKNELFCLTVNPFYPRYNAHDGTYHPAYVDKRDLLQSMRAGISSVPVVDVCQPPVPNLLDLCGITPQE
jgi:hypothetical protein